MVFSVIVIHFRWLYNATKIFDSSVSFAKSKLFFGFEKFFFSRYVVQLVDFHILSLSLASKTLLNTTKIVTWTFFSKKFIENLFFIYFIKYFLVSFWRCSFQRWKNFASLAYHLTELKLFSAFLKKNSNNILPWKLYKL